MSRRKRFWLILGGSIAGGLVLLVLTALLVVQTQWFGNFVKNKIIATTEESTGGHVEIGSFQFDPWHLTVRIRNFVLHGTEPAGADPLARVALLEVHLKLFAGLKHTLDLAYLGLSEPKVNLIVNPDGTTNVPAPKVKKAPSQTSGLETVVDLAIGQFKVDNGLLLYAQKTSQFSARGNNLQALLNFNGFNSTYTGTLRIDPLQLSMASGTPLDLHIMLPVMLEKDAVSISGGRLFTSASEILVNAGLRNLNAPKISARVNANVSLAEMRKSFNLPLDLDGRGVPQNLTAELNANYDQAANSIQLQAAHLALGQTNLEAAGSMQPGSSKAVQFNGSLALDQLSHLFKLQPTQLNGALHLHGRAALDRASNYAVDGTLNSKGLSIRNGTTSLSNVELASPFHADPFLISMDGIKLSVLGGSLGAKVFVEKMQDLSVEGRLNNFSIPVLARVLAGHALGYDGSISGSLIAKSDLKAKGTSGLRAQTELVISPGSAGVPLSGRIAGKYNGASGVVDLAKSYIAMPNSRLDLAGNINQQLNLSLVSHNLDDFLPAVNFGAAHPTTEMPVKLTGGEARITASVNGALSVPNISAHAAIDRFVVAGSPIQHVGLDLAASQTGAAVSNGTLTSTGLRSSFDASIGLRKWQPQPRSPLSANLSVPNGDLKSILALTGQEVDASGKLNAEVHVNGTYGDPLGNASLQLLNGVVYTQPVDKVQVNVDLIPELITLSTLEVDAAGGQLLAHGTFRHPADSFQVGQAQFHVNSSDLQLANLRPLQQRSPGAAGVLKLVADGAAELRKSGTETELKVSNLSTDFSAQNLRVNNQAAGSLFAQARTVNGQVNYNVHSDFAGSAIEVNGQTSLARDFATKAAASIQNLSVEKVLAIAGQAAIPAKGTLSANANVAGTLTHPDATLAMTLDKAVIYTEPLNEFSTKLHYTSTQIDIPNLNVKVPAGSLTASANYAHKDGDLNSGHMELHLNSSDIDLAKIRHLSQTDPGLGGGLKLMANIVGDVRAANGKPEVLFSDVNADVNAHGLRANNKDLGELHLGAKTQQHVVQYSLESNLAKAQLKASGSTALSGDYVTHARLTFGNIKYANIAPFIPSDDPSKPSFDAQVDGEASVDGPILNVDAVTARLQLNQLAIHTTPLNSATGGPGARQVQFQNQGPIVMALAHSIVAVQQFRIQGPKTYLEAGGSASLNDSQSALALTMKGDLDLGILQDADRDFFSSGNILLDATIHGALAKPLVNGQIELKNANINYAESPNGLENGNGVILLNGTNATIQNLTGESGGGKIVLTGFAGLSPDTFLFNLHATASRVRTRYSGISLTSSANISLAGTGRRSVLDGTLTIHRIAYSSNSDAGSILSSASVPPSTSAAPSPLLSGMRLDIRINTAADLRVVSTYTEQMSVTSTLNVRGTAQDPGILGRLNITNGQLVFFGNTYTVNTGSINFYNPNQIDPILDLSLETNAQGVNVILGVTGPVNDLKLSYRSDPPLSFEQIVQLLATNTTPSDPTIAAHQPNPPQQSTSQLGESAVLGQAVANPLASRVQRVFGLTQFKIDPSFSGSNGQPSARVTLQQKIASNLTFTYITDVTQTNSEIVRIQLDITPSISAVGLRDYNGNVSVELFYKFQKR